ncbi:hypothetical protein NPIL_566951 [Nephila pilipes]|uniref:Uncharacterized protein n=1 Tax=Nephila pilipes TaxID=299642 RepID=A0A8X6QLU5_NEPPI|nr:hypothetical protein NPIL_566951 [Nephila pilipes]
MSIAFLSEIMIYFISCFLVDFMRGDMPSFGEIFVCVFINEIIKILFKWNYGNEAPIQSTIIPDQNYDIIEEENIKKGIPIVYSFMIFKICEGLDIKVQLAPNEQRDAWGRLKILNLTNASVILLEIISMIIPYRKGNDEMSGFRKYGVNGSVENDEKFREINDSTVNTHS